MAALTPSLVGTPGAAAATATSVITPTTLQPALPTGAGNGGLLLCFTACRSATPTVAVSGWTSLLNVTGTNGRLAVFAKANGTEVAVPNVVWTTLTTGTSGTPAAAQVACFQGLDVRNLATITDVAGAANDGVAGTATSVGGAQIITAVDKSLVLSLTTRLDDAFTTFTAPAGFTLVSAAFGTASGLDFAIAWAYQVKTPAGTVTTTTFGLTGATSFASSGAMTSLKAGVGALVYPRRNYLLRR